MDTHPAGTISECGVGTGSPQPEARRVLDLFPWVSVSRGRRGAAWSQLWIEEDGLGLGGASVHGGALRLFVRRRLIEFTEGFFIGGPSDEEALCEFDQTPTYKEP